jgi:hypothetical protein
LLAFRLFPEHFLDVADFALNLSTCLLRRTAIAQVGIVGRLASLLLNRALRFVKSAFSLILCA